MAKVQKRRKPGPKKTKENSGKSEKNPEEQSPAEKPNSKPKAEAEDPREPIEKPPAHAQLTPAHENPVTSPAIKKVKKTRPDGVLAPPAGMALTPMAPPGREAQLLPVMPERPWV